MKQCKEMIYAVGSKMLPEPRRCKHEVIMGIHGDYCGIHASAHRKYQSAKNNDLKRHLRCATRKMLENQNLVNSLRPISQKL